MLAAGEDGGASPGIALAQLGATAEKISELLVIGSGANAGDEMAVHVRRDFALNCGERHSVPRVFHRRIRRRRDVAHCSVRIGQIPALAECSPRSKFALHDLVLDFLVALLGVQDAVIVAMRFDGSSERSDAFHFGPAHRLVG